jgi:hypothetical protein
MEHMKTQYLLITKTGRCMVFSVLACAELYQTIYGGILQQVGQQPLAVFQETCTIQSIK